MRELEVAGRDDVALEPRRRGDVLGGVAERQVEDQLLAFVDDNGGLRARGVGGGVVVQRASAALSNRTKRILGGVADRNTGVKAGLVRHEREEQVRAAGVDGEGGGGLRILNETRSSFRGSSQRVDRSGGKSADD